MYEDTCDFSWYGCSKAWSWLTRCKRGLVDGHMWLRRGFGCSQFGLVVVVCWFSSAVNDSFHENDVLVSPRWHPALDETKPALEMHGLRTDFTRHPRQSGRTVTALLVISGRTWPPSASWSLGSGAQAMGPKCTYTSAPRVWRDYRLHLAPKQGAVREELDCPRPCCPERRPERFHHRNSLLQTPVVEVVLVASFR